MNTQHKSQQFYARVAGLSYIVFTLAGILDNFILSSTLASSEQFLSHGVFANEQHFRWGIFSEIVMFAAVTTASMGFYLALKPINKPLMQTALCFRLVEIIIGSFVVTVSMSMLALSNKAYLLNVFDAEQIRHIIVIASSFRQPASEYSWIFMGVAGIMTFYLFFKTNYIPKAWSVWGMITYSSLIIYPVAKLLIADLPREAMFVMFPGALFELGVGCWLLTKGLDFSAYKPELIAKTESSISAEA